MVRRYRSLAMICDDELPASIGRYQIESRVGAGSAGVVYRARDPLLDRLVAIKVPRVTSAAELTISNLGADFYREAAIAGRRAHTHWMIDAVLGRLPTRKWVGRRTGGEDFVSGSVLFHHSLVKNLSFRVGIR